jgi:hypothetical protein
MKVAALYVERDGAYYGLPNVDPWDAERDARGTHQIGNFDPKKPPLPDDELSATPLALRGVSSRMMHFS